MERKHMSGYKNLVVYQLAFRMAIDIFNDTKKFPKEEKYALVDQVRRSARSVAVNIAEAWGKRMYRNHFISKLSDSYAEANETITWLDFALSHSYLTKERHAYYDENYDHINRMLFNMMKNPEKFLLKTCRDY